MNIYALDSLWYYSAMVLSWDSILKLEFDLICDPEMMMLERGVRGGVSMVSTRRVKANNSYRSTYERTKLNKYIQYLDSNNQRGWAMSLKLPVGGIKWMNKRELKRWRKHVCFLEVDLEYPKTTP